jgi:hypothetical protein
MGMSVWIGTGYVYALHGERRVRAERKAHHE